MTYELLVSYSDHDGDQTRTPFRTPFRAADDREAAEVGRAMAAALAGAPGVLVEVATLRIGRWTGSYIDTSRDRIVYSNTDCVLA